MGITGRIFGNIFWLQSRKFISQLENANTANSATWLAQPLPKHGQLAKALNFPSS
jgi:hypothetical protein